MTAKAGVTALGERRQMVERPLPVHARAAGKVYAEHYGIAAIVIASFVAGAASISGVL